MDCVVIAGGVPGPDDPLYEWTQGAPKALMPLNGRYLIEYVLDALEAARTVDEVVVIGLDNPGQLQAARTAVTFLPDHGSLAGNGVAGLNWLEANRQPGMALTCTADIPTLTGEIIDEFVASCQRSSAASLYYNLVTKETMEARFPGSNRTFVKIKGMEISGGDLIMTHTRYGNHHQELWEALTQARKNAWKLARIIGWQFLLKFLLRQVTIPDMEAVAYKILGEQVKIVLSPYAELAMDADKPAQAEMLSRELAGAI